VKPATTSPVLLLVRELLGTEELAIDEGTPRREHRRDDGPLSYERS
jgi:hypothetical protein